MTNDEVGEENVLNDKISRMVILICEESKIDKENVTTNEFDKECVKDDFINEERNVVSLINDGTGSIMRVRPPTSSTSGLMIDKIHEETRTRTDESVAMKTNCVASLLLGGNGGRRVHEWRKVGPSNERPLLPWEATRTGPVDC